MSQDENFQVRWSRYALLQIRQLVDKPRDRMTDDELSVYTFAANALAGGDPVIAMFERGPGHRLCRVCGAEWSEARVAEHVSGCPVTATPPGPNSNASDGPPAAADTK